MTVTGASKCAPPKAQGYRTCRLEDDPLPSVPAVLLLLSPVPAMLPPLLKRRPAALRVRGSAMLLRAVFSGEGLRQGCVMRVAQ